MTESRYRAVKAYENLEWINSRDARPLRHHQAASRRCWEWR